MPLAHSHFPLLPPSPHRSALTLAVDGVTVYNLPDGPYTLTLTVTNFYSLTATATFAFEKKASGAVPSVEIIRGADTFTAARGLSLSSQINKASICGSARVEYLWQANVSSLVPAALATRRTLRVPGPILGLVHGTVYNITLTSKFAGSANSAQDSVLITAQGSPLKASLRGPSGDVKNNAVFTLNAASSLDPDDPSDSVEPMRYEWVARREVSQQHAA